MREPGPAGQTPADKPEFQDVATSSTCVYRFDSSHYPAVVDALEMSPWLGALRQPAAGDFTMMGTSILNDIADRSVVRRQLSVDLAVDADQPIFAHTRASPIVIVSTCSAERTVGITINFFFDCASADQLIAVAQSMYGRPSAGRLMVTGPFSDSSGDDQSIQRVQTAIAQRLLTREYHARNHFRSVEIRRIGDTGVARDAIREHLCPLYGVLTADEGWRYVSREFAGDRLAEVWGTREFVSVASIGDTALMINLRADDYSAAQNEFFGHYFHHHESYFSHRYHLAGLEHGQFLSQELCAYRQCVIDDLQRRLSQRRLAELSVSLWGGIGEQARRKSLDRSLVEDLFRLRDHPPSELNALVNAIEARSGLPERLASLRQEVRAMEAEDQTSYLYLVNQILIRAAWIGIVIAIVAAFVAIVTAIP